MANFILQFGVRIEHVFGFIENSMHGSSLRSIGFDRAVLNTDLTNLTYNLLRYEQVKRLISKHGGNLSKIRINSQVASVT